MDYSGKDKLIHLHSDHMEALSMLIMMYIESVCHLTQILQATPFNQCNILALKCWQLCVL